MCTPCSIWIYALLLNLMCPTYTIYSERIFCICTHTPHTTLFDCCSMIVAGWLTNYFKITTTVKYMCTLVLEKGMRLHANVCRVRPHFVACCSLKRARISADLWTHGIPKDLCLRACNTRTYIHKRVIANKIIIRI